MNNLVSQLNSYYTVLTTTTKYDNNHEVFDIVVMYKEGSLLSDRNLTKLQTKLFYNGIVKGSDEAVKWVNEIIQVYISKGLSTALEIIPGMKFLPYELLFDSKPDPSTISISGNALNCELSTNSIFRFTYVRENTNSSWVYCCSSNQVRADFFIREIKYTAGGINPSSKQFPQRRYDGGYSNAVSNAVTIYNAMKTSSYVSSGNFCVNQVSYTTVYKGSLINKILSPTTPFELSYHHDL